MPTKNRTAAKSRTHKPRMSRADAGAQSLRNAVCGTSLANLPAIFRGFEEMGIPADDVKPRENVFTYNAWRALGRQVRKGVHGVKVLTWIEGKSAAGAGDGAPAGEAGQDQGEGGARGFRFSRTTTVFHLSQTDPIAQPAAVEGAAA